MFFLHITIYTCGFDQTDFNLVEGADEQSGQQPFNSLSVCFTFSTAAKD